MKAKNTKQSEAVKDTAKQSKTAKVVKAVKKAVKITKDSFIKLTARTWNADITQTAICFFWVHNRVRSDVNERLAESDSLNHKSGKTFSLFVDAHNGQIARDGEFDSTGKFMRVRNYATGGGFTGWMNVDEIQKILAGATFTFFADASALARTLKHAEQRKASGGDSYACVMSNDLGKAYYAASVRRVNGKLISWHEENKRNAYNTHEVSATEKELARKAVIGS